MAFLNTIGGDFVAIGNTNLPISRSFKEDLLQRLKFYY